MKFKGYLRINVNFIVLAFCILSFLKINNIHANDNQLQIHFLNVPGADASIIKLPDDTIIMIDAGFEKDGAMILNYLHLLRVSRIDTIIVTHSHENHYGGFIPIIKRVPVNRVFVNGDGITNTGYQRLINEVRKKKIPVQTLRRGDVLNYLPKKTSLEVLHPKVLSGNINDDSMVINFRYKDVEVLFTSDIGMKIQDELLVLFEDIRNVDCIKSPCHGEKMGEFFTQVMADKTFIVPAGPNTFDDGAYKAIKGKIINLFEVGTTVLNSNGDTITFN